MRPLTQTNRVCGNPLLNGQIFTDSTDRTKLAAMIQALMSQFDITDSLVHPIRAKAEQGQTITRNLA
jgi:hypothetical protein